MNTLLLAAAPGGSNNWIMFFAFILLIGFTYFTMLRPQKKQNQKRLEMIKALKKGDRVVMISGLHGKVDEINEKDRTMVLDADGIYLTFNVVAVRDVIPTTSATTTTATAESKEDSSDAVDTSIADQSVESDEKDTDEE